MELYELTAHELVDRLAAGEVSAADAVESQFARIEAVEGQIDAYLQLTKEVALEQAGAFMLSIECVPDRLARVICERLTIPATGIGSGPYTDGQSLSLYDMIGLFDRFKPKFVKQYSDVSKIIVQTLEDYLNDVKNGNFPSKEHSFTVSDDVLETVLNAYGMDSEKTTR